MADERNDRPRKFQPANTRFLPKGRPTTHHRSLMNLTSSVVNETASTVDNTRFGKIESKETGFVRRIPKFFRWGGNKKVIPTEPVPKVLSDPTESIPATSVPNASGFIGNLGIGHYITSDESAFLNYDAHDENIAPVSKGFSKSMVDLSSITPWSSTPTEPIPIRSSRNASITESEADSVSNSSHSDHFSLSSTSHKPRDFGIVPPEYNLSIPNLIKVLFFTNLPYNTCSVGKDTLTNNQDPTPEQRRMTEAQSNAEFVPAWLITANGLMPNVSYVVYRTHDYLSELRKAIRWLEDYENQRGKQKKSSRRYQSPAGLRFASDLRSRRLIFDTSSFAMSFPYAAKKKRSPTDDNAHMDEVTGSGTLTTLFTPKEGKIMLKLLSDASRIIESISLYPEVTRTSQYGLNAWIIRNVAINCNSSELNGRMLLPDMEKPPSGRVHTVQEMKQVFRLESAQIYEIPTATGEMQLVLNESRFRETTVYLTSSHLLFSSTFPGSQTIYSTQFQHILPLCELWCSKLNLSFEDEIVQADEGQNVVVTEDMTLRAPVSLNSSSLTEPEETVGISPSVNEHNSSFGRTQTFLIGRPPSDNWYLRFVDKNKMERWSAYLHDAISYNQRLLIGRTLYIKIMNQVADNQIVYKYHKVYLTTSVKELKEKALESMNINRKTDVRIWVRYNTSEGIQKELPLIGHESPFLIALILTVNFNESYVARNSASDTATQNKVVDLFDPLRRGDADTCVTQMEQFLAQLPDTNPLFPRDQVRVEFLLRTKERLAMQPKRHRSHGPVKPSDVKKSHSHFTSNKMQKEKSGMLDKTKSTLFLPTEAPKAIRTGGALRGARSTGCLNATAEKWAIFGRIPEEIWPSAVLPQSLVSLFVILYYTGADVEGIFRKTASTSQIQMMRARVDENIDPITPATCPPIVAAGVLKRFFGEIPGHLLIDDRWEEWICAVRLQSANERFELLETLIRKLPRVNQTLVALLLHLLAHVRDHEAVNRMSTEALGTVWGPNLIEKPQSSPNPEDARMAYQVVVCLLDRQFTTRMLHESCSLHQEITRHYRTAWELMNANSSTNLPDDQNSSTSRSRSTQESSVADQLEFVGDNSCASSLRSDSDAVDEVEPMKTSLVHLSVPLTTFGSKSASPPRDASHQAALPSLDFAENQKTSFINRRRLLLRSEIALPDQIPPSKVEPLYDDTRLKMRCYTRRLLRPTSSQDDEMSITLKVSQQPPPVPPRINVTDNMSMRTLELNRVPRENDDKHETTAPPVPPKVKPRSRGPLKATATSSDVTSYLLTSRDSATATNDHLRCQSAMSRNSVCSLPAALGYEARLAGPFSWSPWFNSTTRIPGQRSFRSEARRINQSNTCDRRHGSVERVSFSSLFSQANPKTTGDSIKINPQITTARTPLAELPRTEAPGFYTQHTNCTAAQNSGDPCGYTVYRVESRKYLINTPPPPTPPRQQQLVRETELETRRRRANTQKPVTDRRRPYSIDRSTFNLARQVIKPVVAEGVLCATSQTPVILEPSTSSEYPKDYDWAGTDRAQQRRPCVRRISSHASTISSESNTLVSTSTEKVDSLS